MSFAPTVAHPESVSTRVFIETPEQIQFAYELAGIAPRMLAWMIDSLIRGVFMIAVYFAITLLTQGMEFGQGIVMVAFFVLEWGYYTLLEWLWDGCTPGKKALRLRVVRTDGIPLDLYRSAMRNLLRAADGFPFFTYGVGMISRFASGRARRLGDIAADTMVIREDRKALVALPPLPDRAPLFSSDELARVGVTSRVLATIEAFFRRKRLFSKARSRELALLLAMPMAEALGRTDDEDPEVLLAGILMSGHEARVSVPGRESVPPRDGVYDRGAAP